MDYIIREIANSMDLDPDKVANSMTDAAVQAEILKKFQAENPPEPPQCTTAGCEPPQQHLQVYRYRTHKVLVVDR